MNALLSRFQITKYPKITGLYLVGCMRGNYMLLNPFLKTKIKNFISHVTSATIHNKMSGAIVSNSFSLCLNIDQKVINYPFFENF